MVILQLQITFILIAIVKIKCFAAVSLLQREKHNVDGWHDELSHSIFSSELPHFIACVYHVNFKKRDKEEVVGSNVKKYDSQIKKEK